MEVIDRPGDKIRNAIDFVSSLHLATPRGVPLKASRPDVADDEPAGYVDCGSLVSFVAGVPAQHQTDVLDSTLLAQLAASARHDRETQPEDWYKYYADVLRGIGWVAYDFAFDRYHPQGADFTADKVIEGVLEGVATADEMVVVEATIAAVKALNSGDALLSVWENNSRDLTSGNFQIAVASSLDGDVALKFGAFLFDTDTSVTDVLTFQFPSTSTNFLTSREMLVLDEEVYQQVRAAVEKQLGKRAGDSIGSLSIDV